MSEPITLTVSVEPLDALAGRVAALPRTPPNEHEPSSPGLDLAAARVYTGLSKETIYQPTAARAIPLPMSRRRSRDE